MNKFMVTGRVSKEHDSFVSKNGVLCVSILVSVRRNMRDKNTGKYESDLFRFKAFGANAEFANKFLQKGDCVEIESHIINFAYIKDNQRVYKMDFLIDHIGYLPYKKRNIPGINERLAKTIDYMPEDPFLAYDNIDIPPIKQSVGHSYDKVPF